ncbi:MAG: hypothetical protein HQL06_07290 [Nitrospirae bacterium]|nr:hypothetical protein [Nitrospirota bacterium]
MLADSPLQINKTIKHSQKLKEGNRLAEDDYQTLVNSILTDTTSRYVEQILVERANEWSNMLYGSLNRMFNK